MKQPPDHTVGFLACRSLRRYAETLREHLDGACTGEKIEDIHQVRVACRRLRAALRLFEDCFDPKLLRQWRRELKRVLRRLGDARDRDVQMEFLQGILGQITKTDKKIRPGVQRIELRWKQQRQCLQRRVVKAVHRFRDSGILMEMHLETEKILFDLKEQEPSAGSPVVFRRAGDQIRLRMEDLLGRQGCLDNPEDMEGHHAMRISAKRLRYTLEICGPVFRDGLKPFIKALKQLQTLLGDLHDCDLWADRITAFAEEETQRTKEYYGYGRAFGRLAAGLEYLKEDRRKHRAEIFGQTQAFCGQLNQEGFWDSLQEILQQEPEDDGHDEKAPDGGQPG